jgi:predicted molibdopterin-dependent oxidoreductase YjgC
MSANMERRIKDHPVLGPADEPQIVHILVDGSPVQAVAGEPVAAALMAAGIKVFHWTSKASEPRGLFCAVGLCTDCMMTVDGVPNVRTCITPVRDGMRVRTQRGLGSLEPG